MPRKKTNTQRTPEENATRIRVKKKLFELYFNIQTSSYLIMNKKTGIYYTHTAGKKSDSGKVTKKLADWQIYMHLEGQHTIGTKGGKFMNTFLSFDVDFPDISVSKWITQKLSIVLTDMKIEHHVSFSGKKGFHVDIFFEDLVTRKIHRNIFDYVLDQADVRQFFKSKKSNSPQTIEYNGVEFQLGDVEYRPSEGYGIKIPLGVHQKTKLFCGFCDKSDNLKVMNAAESYEYLLNIKKINCKDIVENYFPELDSYRKINQYVPKKEFQKTEGTITKYSQPAKYNQTEDEAINEATDLLTKGMKYKHSRHNSIFKITKLLKYNGVEEDDAIECLLEWMEHQPKELYESTVEDVRHDIVKTVHDVFQGKYTIKPPEKDIAVTYAEIIAIINSCPRETEKLLTYAMLIHSKRYATKAGVFYFTQEEIAKATGLSLRTVKDTLPKLEKLGILEYVKRNQKFDWKIEQKPRNEYMLLLKTDPTIIESKVYITDRQDDLNYAILNFFTIDDLKKKQLPRRHLDKLKDMNIG